MGIYSSNWPQEKKGFKACKQAFFNGLNLPLQWSPLLEQVEIIYGEQQVELFMQLNGSSVVGQIFSPTRLEQQINHLMVVDDTLKKTSTESEEQTLEINNQLNKLIHRIKDIRVDPFYYRKSQNILRNLGVHWSVLKLFRLQTGERNSNIRDTYKIAIKFLSLFIQGNGINCQQIMSDYDNILNFATHKLKISKLLGLLLIQDSEQNQQLYKRIFKKMMDNSESVHVYTSLYGTLIAIVRWAEKMKYGKERLGNLKRDFLSNLFKLPFFIVNL